MNFPKINIPVRMKNVWFWVGIGGVVMTAMGVSPETFTTWDAVGAAFVDVVSNPYMLGSVVLAVIGVFVDPTTAGVTDSNLAMTYAKPKKDVK